MEIRAKRVEFNEALHEIQITLAVKADDTSNTARLPNEIIVQALLQVRGDLEFKRASIEKQIADKDIEIKSLEARLAIELTREAQGQCPNSPDNSAHWYVVPSPKDGTEPLGICKYCKTEQLLSNDLLLQHSEETTA